ncbi:MAG: CarboxypepD reg-like domain, partial [Verrucomicrobiota bacterium]
MKPSSFLPVAWALLFLGLVPCGQAQPATAAVSGRVQSEVTGQYLLNVRVTVKGTDLTAFTDSYGIFRLAGVPSGTVTL